MGYMAFLFWLTGVEWDGWKMKGWMTGQMDVWLYPPIQFGSDSGKPTTSEGQKP